MSLTSEEREKCESIIRKASREVAHIGRGRMPQILFANADWLVPIQIKMITALGTVFDVNLTESTAEGLYVVFSSPHCIKEMPPFWISCIQILEWKLPILRNAINARKAAEITKTIGWRAVEHFTAERGVV